MPEPAETPPASADLPGRLVRTWRTVRQPNDVAVDPATGRLVVVGTADGLLQFLDAP